MKTTIFLTSMLLAGALAGCLSDDAATDNGDDTWTAPHYEGFDDASLGLVSSLEPLARMTNATGDTPFGAGGIWLHENLAFGSGLGRGATGFWIADVSVPEDPVLLWNSSANSETPFSRDADVVAHDDGRLTLVLATQSSGMHVWDVTDPTAPVFAATVDVSPNHNIATVPNTTLVFNSQSGGLGTTNDLIDVADPYNPVVLGSYGSHGCHDISYFGEPGADKFRAYCAGIDRTEIWSLDGFDASAGGDFGITLLGTVEGTDSPVVGNPVFGSHPTRTLHHLAIVNNDASILIIGDEHNGGGSPGACFAYDPLTGKSTPFGALWFYDISDEANPALLSWLSPPSEGFNQPQPDPNANAFGVVPSCTAHFGTVLPGQERLVMAWYHAGTQLIDFADPRNPTIVDAYDPEDGNVWDARYHDGYVFTGDINRGLEVLSLA